VWVGVESEQRGVALPGFDYLAYYTIIGSISTDYTTIAHQLFIPIPIDYTTILYSHTSMRSNSAPVACGSRHVSRPPTKGLCGEVSLELGVGERGAEGCGRRLLHWLLRGDRLGGGRRLGRPAPRRAAPPLSAPARPSRLCDYAFAVPARLPTRLCDYAKTGRKVEAII